MKHTIIPLLQQRMDKCTREQFWAVAALTAADGFLATHVDDIASKIPSCILLFAMTAATVWGILIIVDRHFAFYRNRAALASLLKGEPDVPDFLKAHGDPIRSLFTLSGVVFYLGWVVLGCVLCYVAVLTNHCS